MGIHTMDMKTVSPDSLTVPVSNTNTAGLSPSIEGNTNSVPQVLVGYQKNGFGTGIDQGIKVSRQGVDVKTATNDQLVMSSAFNSFKIVASGVATVSKPPGQYLSTTTIAHGQSAAPIFMAYFLYDGGYTPIPFTAMNSSGVGVMQFWANSTSSNIVIQLAVPSGAPYDALDLTGSSALALRYYILVETAAV